MRKALFSIFVCCPVLLLRAQTPPSGGVGLWDANHFMWFTGHWSKTGNKVMFVIDKGAANTGGGAVGVSTGTDPAGQADVDGIPANPSTGGTISFNADGTMNVSSGSIDDWNKKIDDVLNNEQKYLKGLEDPKANLDPATHHLNQMLIPEEQQMVQKIQGYKIDPSQDMFNPGNTKPQAAPTLSDAVGDICKDLKGDYDYVMNYYNNQVKGHWHDLKYPAPPVFDNDCYSCDSNRQAQVDTTDDRYVQDFAKDDLEAAAKGFSILGQLSRLGINENMASYPDGLGDLFLKNKQNPNKAGACSFIDLGGFSKACYAIAKHAYKRAEQLVYDNRTNYQAATVIVNTWIRLQWIWICATGEKEDESMSPVLGKLIGEAVDDQIAKLQNHNWRLIGNVPLLLGMIRTEESLGTQSIGQGDAQYNALVRIVNHFKLTVDMQVKIGVNNGYKLAHLKGECYVIPYFEQDKDQCYKWVIADENQREIGVDGNGFYLAKELQTFDVKLLTNEMVTPPNVPRITYTGTKAYTTGLTNLAMDFCNPGHDTINLTGFTPNPPDAGTWKYPEGIVTNDGVTGFEQYFEDINAKKRFATDGEAAKAKDDLKEKAEQLRVQMETLKAQMTAGQSGGSAGGGASASGAASAPPGADYEKMMEFKQKALAQVAAPVIAKLVYLDFMLPVRNNSAKLVHAEFDAKKINPQEAKVLLYGFYRIDIENTATPDPVKN